MNSELDLCRDHLVCCARGYSLLVWTEEEIMSEEICVYTSGENDYPKRSDPRRCKGEVTFGPDPYLDELYQDSTPVWMCESCRAERADDI